MAKLGLVTVLFNSDNVLEGFFKSLSYSDYKDYCLYIIDNTPSSTTDELLLQLSNTYSISAIKHIKSEKNIGVAAGNNVGIIEAFKDGVQDILLLNNDIEWDDVALLGEMYTSFQRQNMNLLIPKIYFYEPANTLWMAGAKFVKWKALTFHIGEGETDKGQYDENITFNYAPTCFMFISRKVFDEIGLMDEKFFVYFDDTDFIYRAYQKGHRVHYSPKHSIKHKVSSSTGGGESVFTIKIANRNRVYFIRKHYSFFWKVIAYTCLIGSYLKKKRQYSKTLVSAMEDGLSEGLKMVK